ncbi:VOC family protein [Actibacterium sp. D379-3]
MLRYKKLGYVELNVSDMARSRDFYERVIGLEYVGQGADGAVLLRCGDDPYNVALRKAPEPGHKRAGWMLESVDQFDVLEKQLADNGVPFEILSDGECSERGLLRATRIIEPNTQAVVEFYLNTPPDAHYFFQPTVAKIQRLGHVVYATPNFDAAVSFYKDVLNFAESDTIDDTFTFMRPFPNPYHHGIGIGRAEKNVYHHTNFMVSEIDDVGVAIHRLNSENVPIVFGPGRHPASGSVFLYFLDPDGLTCEYSFGMEEFSEDFARAPRRLTRRPQAADSWAAPLDPRMGKIGKIEDYAIG